MSIAIVTPWRDHPELATDYFAAVEAGKPDQLIVVDDGSQEPLEFAATRIEQGGFCTASNAGLALVETEQVLFLNNDIAMLRPNWLDSIREVIQDNVIIGPLIFQNKLGPVEHPYIDGWCAGMTTKDARRLGWDESYDRAGPAYFSDNALSLNARLQGFTLRELRPGLRHKGGQTGGVDLMLFNAALQANGVLFDQQVREALG